MTRTFAAATCAAILIATASACSSEQDDAAAWIARAAEANETADRARAAGDLERARDALRAAAEPRPPDGVDTRDARIVRQDLYFRLAELELEAGSPQASLRFADAGLALGRDDDVFTANLHIARGRALEALGREVDATVDYHEALKIDDVLLRRTLEPGDNGTGDTR